MQKTQLPQLIVYIVQPIILLAGFFVIRAYLADSTMNVFYYRFALYSFACIVLLMEIRVLLGKRGKRDVFFYIHLMSGLAVMTLLTVLGFSHVSVLLEIEAVLFAALTLSTGIVLLRRKTS